MDDYQPGDCEDCHESDWPMCPEHMAIEIDELRSKLELARAAMRECIEAHYVGGGRVVCTNSLKPHLDAFAKLLSDTPKGGA
jgi:hypothetical protein